MQSETTAGGAAFFFRQGMIDFEVARVVDGVNVFPRDAVGGEVVRGGPRTCKYEGKLSPGGEVEVSNNGGDGAQERAPVGIDIHEEVGDRKGDATPEEEAGPLSRGRFSGACHAGMIG